MLRLAGDQAQDVITGFARQASGPGSKYHVGPLGLAFALAMALSLGDLGAASLYGNADFITLPVLLAQRMGAYRTDDAAALALILGLLCLGLMAVAERLMARKAP